MTQPVHLPDTLLFSHDAMHTTFSLRIAGESEHTARGVARECCELLDGLESRLSRFIPGSDIWQINHLRAGQTIYLSAPCHQCLLAALDAHARTGGLFDVTLGTRITHRKTGAAGPPPDLTGSLEVHPDVPAITCHSPGRHLDLGGIGKGFALDQISKLLADWGVGRALVAAGASTLLATGGEAWPVDLTGATATLRITLTDHALAASGTGAQGDHIVDPRDGHPPAPGRQRVWLLAASATLADALSTAAMLMSPAELAALLTADQAVEAIWLDHGGEIEPVLTN
jgi:thiamine biosynthesis lipoprotein